MSWTPLSYIFNFNFKKSSDNLPQKNMILSKTSYWHCQILVIEGKREYEVLKQVSKKTLGN